MKYLLFFMCILLKSQSAFALEKCPSPKKTVTVISKNAFFRKEHIFCVEVALTNEAKQKGLMFRTLLDSDAGMLFPYKKEKKINVWMRNTYIPLDIIFIGADKKIKYIYKNAPILSDDIISSPGKSKTILEIKGGMTDLLSIRAEDEVLY